MNTPTRNETIPRSLLQQLASYRRALLAMVARENSVRWMIVALSSLVFLLVLDRFVDTPKLVRIALWMVVVGWLLFSIVDWLRTLFASRTVLQIAQLIRKEEPVYGDHLLGALELSSSESEQSRSASLCAAALQQVADETQRRDLRSSLPEKMERWLVRVAIACLSLVLVVSLAVPGLVRSTIERLAMPWSTLSRFTFVQLETPSLEVIVPHDEESSWTVAIDPASPWRPKYASMSYGAQRLKSEELAENQYRFNIPRTIEPKLGKLAIGDARSEFQFRPVQRSTLTELKAKVTLPSYLHSRTETKELRGGVLQLIEGSEAEFQAVVSAPLDAVVASAKSADLHWSATVSGNTFRIPLADTVSSFLIHWTDQNGLSAAEPVEVTVETIEDLPPTLIVRADPFPSKLLDSHQLAFELLAEDDFAVAKVAMRWSSADSSGETILGGAALKRSAFKGAAFKGAGQGSVQALRRMDLAGVFQADAMKIPLGKIMLQFAVLDEYPGREPVLSSPMTFEVLSPNEHAVWVAEEFDKWRQSTMDVRDRELNLYQQNRRLSDVKLEDRDQEWREAIEQQSRDERLNGRLLDALTRQGEDLLRQAARNEEVSSEYIQSLAESIESLESLASNRMPSIAKRLAEAARGLSKEEESKFAEMADQETSQGNAKRANREGLDEPNGASEDKGEGDGATKERIGLAGTTIVDTTQKPNAKTSTKSGDLVEVLDDQALLVAEFDAVAEQLAELLGKMEGSTLVKRLKSVSRLQDRVAVNLGREIGLTFGEPAEDQPSLRSATVDVRESAKRIRTVLDDLEALCERRDIEHFKVVLDEMKVAGVLDQLNELSDSVKRYPGLAISASEYWADNLDRWADDLVDPRSGESKAGLKTTKSLSPDIILKVLRILESEVNLRDRTRMAEQSRESATRDQYMEQAIQLSEEQDLLRDRLDVIVQSLESEEDGLLHFASEIEVLAAASSAMVDASKTLIQPETGPAAIAAETEAIELLLRSKKVSPESGGGGGGTAGGGSGGTTDQAAARLLGRGLNELAEQRELETDLNVGRSRDEIPVQWREGLDAYYQGMERRRRGRANE